MTCPRGCPRLISLKPAKIRYPPTKKPGSAQIRPFRLLLEVERPMSKLGLTNMQTPKAAEDFSRLGSIESWAGEIGSFRTLGSECSQESAFDTVAPALCESFLQGCAAVKKAESERQKVHQGHEVWGVAAKREAKGKPAILLLLLFFFGGEGVKPCFDTYICGCGPVEPFLFGAIRIYSGCWPKTWP